MSYGIVMVADVSGNEFGDAGATALCPLLEHQPNLKNLNLNRKCIVWLRYVHILVLVWYWYIYMYAYVCTASSIYYVWCDALYALYALYVLYVFNV